MQNPLQSLTFIAAPALLTNACSLLVLSTSNRFARAVDRTRLLAKTQNEDQGKSLRRAERRALILVRALTGFYTGVGAFACSTFMGLFGSALQTIGQARGLTFFTEAALALAVIGVMSIAIAATFLVRETWIAYNGLIIEAQTLGSGRNIKAPEI
jgi:hypothetical protein